MTVVIVSDPGDELEPILQELSVERRALQVSERADIEGRVANHEEWTAAMSRRRQRVSDLEAQRDVILGQEEAAAESDWRPAA